MQQRLFLLFTSFVLVSGLGYAEPTVGTIERSKAVLKQEHKEKSFLVTDTMRAEMKYVVSAMENSHLNKRPIEEIDAEVLMKQFLTSLDLNHLFFTQPEVDDFNKRFVKSLPLYLRQGNPYPAFEIFKAYRQKVAARIDWIMELLANGVNFKEDGEYEPVRKKLPWPTSTAEGDKYWTQRIKYELLNEILSQEEEEKDELEVAAKDTEVKKEAQKPKTHAEILKAAKKDLVKRYQKFGDAVMEIEPHEVHEIFLTTFMQQYDPHSNFFSVESMEDFSMSLHNALVGIGAVLTVEDEHVTVKELLPGGPAEKAGNIGPEDQIIGVGQGDSGEITNIVGLKLRKAVKLIRGKEGSTVRLLIKPAGKDPSARKVITIMREEIKLTSNLAQAQLYEKEHNGKVYKIGMIDIPAFYAAENDDPNEPSTTHDVRELLDKLKKLGTQGIILDLRRNGGGLLPEAVTLTGLFIPVGPVVHVQDAKGNIREYLDMDPEMAWEGPLLVLVSRYSASAAEIFTGALKSYNRAIVVGDSSTHGKGTVQVLSDIQRPLFPIFSNKLGKLGATKFTIQKWYLPDGTSTQLRGVKSDIRIPSINEYLPVAESDLDNPLPWDSIDIIPWSHQEFDAYTDSIYDDTLKQLETLSMKRQETMQEFHFLKENIERFRKKQEQKKYSLNLFRRKMDRQEDLKFRDLMEERLKGLSKLNYNSLEIKLDIVPKGDDQDDDVSYTFDNVQDALQGMDTDETDDIPAFDIYLRESVRIMADYLQLKEKNPSNHVATNAEDSSVMQHASSVER